MAPLRARLREATADLHAAVDQLFPRGLDDPASYRRYLLGMHRFASDYEVAVRSMPRHSTWLARDLQALALAPLAAEGPRRPLSAPAPRLGWRYVMAGSALGARRLLRDATRLGLCGTTGAAFLEAHAASEDWPRLLARLDALGDARGSAPAAGVVAGAREAFAWVHACMRRAFDRIPATPTPPEATA